MKKMGKMKRMTPAMAARIRMAAKKATGVKPDKDSAAGAAT